MPQICSHLPTISLFGYSQASYVKMHLPRGLILVSLLPSAVQLLCAFTGHLLILFGENFIRAIAYF